MKTNFAAPRLAAVVPALFLIHSALAQQPPAAPANCAARGFAPAVRHRSVEPAADGRVTFRLCAPNAVDVYLASTDLPGIVPFGGNGPPGLKMSKAADGIWSVTTDKAVDPDNYRYTFLVDGATVPDPEATTFANQRAGTRSTFEMPGEAGKFQSYNPAIAHGVVSVFEYWSKSLGVKRRAHIYTPPGYMNDAKRYPVLYLVHGAGDSDDEWTATGHAQYILDNLIAAGKAKPMIIVMPFGHTPERPPQPPVSGGVGGSAGGGANLLGNQDFGNDLLKDLIPAIDASLRTKAQPLFRAMAGLSMGGGHTLQFGLPHSDVFRYVGVFSMGLGNAENAVSYEKAHADALKRSAREMKLVYYAIGKEDFLYASVAPTRAMLDRQGIHHVYHESGGGHVWINWRAYLNDFAPRLFQ